MSSSSMAEECFNCRLPFDEFEHKPMLLCKEQHFCCEECAQRLLGMEPARCPLCIRSISRNGVVNFRQYLSWLKEWKHSKSLLKKEQAKAGLLPDLAKTLVEVLKFKPLSQEEFYRNVKHMAESLFEEGKKYAAMVLLKGLIERSPNFEQYKFIGLGSKQQNIGFTEGKPLSWFKEQYQITEVSAEDLLSHILMLCPEYDETEWFQAMTSKYSENFRLRYASALNKHNKKDHQGALFSYRRAQELNPNFSKTYCMIAFLQENQAYAQKFASKCLEIQPENILAMYFLALKKEKQEKLTSLREIYERQPEYVRAMKKIGEIFFDNRQCNQALQCFNKCTTNENYLTPFICIAGCKLNLGKNREAIEQLQKLLEGSRFTAEKSFIKYLIGFHTDDQQTSIMHLKQSLEIDPNHQKALIKLASVYFDMKQHQYALRCYQKALNQDERNPIILAQICQCYWKRYNIQGILPYLRRWKEIEPQNVAIDLNLGKAYLQLGNLEKSLEHLLVCTREGPYNAEINMIIIDIYQRLKNFQKVQQLLGRHLRKAELSSEEYDRVVQRIEIANRSAQRLSNSKRNV